jgi:ribosomal protein L37AE/L43A
MPRYEKCPTCGSKDVEILSDRWICWDCTWEDALNQEEEDEREQLGEN